MSVEFAIALHNNTFRGRGADKQATCWPPSPARLIGALLSGAHALRPVFGEPHRQADTAIAAIEELTRSPLPVIVTGDPPVELRANTIWYSPRNAIGDAFDSKTDQELTGKQVVNVICAPACVDEINRAAKARTLSLLPGAATVRYLVDTRPSGEHLEALRCAAEMIGHFGAATDMATVTVSEHDASAADVADARNGDEVAWSPVDAAASESAVRGWTEETVAFYDDIFATGGVAVPGDPRVPMVGYARPGDSPAPVPELVVRPLLGGAVPLRRYADIRAHAERMCAGLDVTIHPAVDRNRAGRVRGLILAGVDRGEAAMRLDGLLDLSALGVHTAMNPDTWSGPATAWESVTAMVAHRDPFIARGEIEVMLADVGLSLVALTAQPWLRHQCPVPGIAVGYSNWYVTATSSDPLPGPVRAGRFIDSGAGLLAPIRRRSDNTMEA